MIGGELTIANLKRRVAELEKAVAEHEAGERLQMQLREKVQGERDALAALTQWRPIEQAEKYEGEFLLYGPRLVDLDFNEAGVVEGHWQDDEGWVGAIWCNDHDCWHEKVIEPTHFLPKFNPYTSIVASLASLARRDALKQAEGIKDAASRWPPGSATRSRLLELAEEIKGKAEAQQ